MSLFKKERKSERRDDGNNKTEKRRRERSYCWNSMGWEKRAINNKRRREVEVVVVSS